MAAEYNFTIDQGSDFTATITRNDQAGDPIDITGYTARMDFKRLHTDTSSELSLTTENSRLSISGAAGQIIITLTDTETALLSRSYVHDLEIINTGGDGAVTRVVEGRATISPEVTK